VKLSYPGHYRELKQDDAYQGIHFGLLDFEILNTENTNGGIMNLHFRLINSVGDSVMEKVMLMQKKRFNEKDTMPIVQTEECIPYWGEVPFHKMLLFRSSMVLFGMIFVLFPICLILWLIGASIYYICIGGELLRRDRIEKRYERRHNLQVKGNKYGKQA
jgi:hypothetical protein